MKKAVVLILITLISGGAMAIPAKPGPRLVTLPSGDTLTIYAHGDEHMHWLSNAQGEWLEQTEEGDYVVVPSLSEEEIAERREESALAPRRAKRAPESSQQATPLNIAPRGLVILVSYKDKAFATDYDVMVEMLNDGDESARQYFIDQSMGQYQPQFDVRGPYTLSQKMSYYGQNNYNGNDANSCEMIVEACKLADKDGVDFTQYDANGDGEIDFVYVIYAGYGEADGGGSSTIWPHSFWVYDGWGQTVRLDGKLLNTYACGNEINYSSRKHTGIGTFCHEFSHVLGLPDLYATNNATHKTMGAWDILDYGPYNNGCNTPPSYSAYERFFMGWLKPTLLDAPRSIRVGELQESNEAYIVTKSGDSNFKGNDPNPQEFYIIENRQQTGWDSYLPGHGMLITKVKYSYSAWVGNTVNNTAKSQGVDIIEADGKAPANSYGKAGDAFPAGAEEYTIYDDYTISRIKEEGETLTFDFMGGADWISSLALEKVNTGKIVYSEIVGVYSVDGRLVRQRVDGEDFVLNDLEPGLYVIRAYTGDDAEKKKYKGTLIRVE